MICAQRSAKKSCLNSLRRTDTRRPHRKSKRPMSSHDPIDVVFSFDTTGSMYPCLTQVRRTIEATVKRLFTEVPNLRIGVTAHGDYCDRGETYVTKHLGLTTDQASITRFVQTVER